MSLTPSGQEMEWVYCTTARPTQAVVEVPSRLDPYIRTFTFYFFNLCRSESGKCIQLLSNKENVMGEMNCYGRLHLKPSRSNRCWRGFDNLGTCSINDTLNWSKSTIVILQTGQFAAYVRRNSDHEGNLEFSYSSYPKNQHGNNVWTVVVFHR